MNRTALVLIAALGLAACGDHGGNTAGDNTAATGNAADATLDNGTADYTSMEGAVTPSAVTTPEFVQKAAISDMYEITSSKLALTRSNSAQVKKFAQAMIDAHTATTATLKKIVGEDKLAAPPPALDADHQALVDKLKSADAKDFDDTYIDQQTAAHKQTLDLMKGYAAGGDNAKLKAFAGDTAPKVQGHLTMVEALDDADVNTTAKPAT